MDREGCNDNESISGTDSDSDSETATEMRQLLGLVRYLVPVVGPSVWVLKLGCCPMLSNGLVSRLKSGLERNIDWRAKSI